jgi:hypothetical protein
MFVENITNTVLPKRIYYHQRTKLELLKYLGVMVMWLYVVVDGLYRWTGGEILLSICWIIYWMFFLLLYLVGLYLWFFYKRVVVSPAGIELYDTLYTICAKWSDIEHVKDVQKGLRHLDVLILKTPRMQKRRWLGWMVFWNPETQLESEGKFIPVEKIIPLGLMFPNWRNSELGRDIRQYIPDLFAEREGNAGS